MHDSKFEKHKDEAGGIFRRQFINMRKHYGLTQAELAEATGKHKNTISNIERGEVDLSLSEFYAYKRIAEEVGTKKALKNAPKKAVSLFKPTTWGRLLSVFESVEETRR